MDIPAFLKDYEEDIKRYKKEYIQISNKNISNEEKTTFFQSKFLGKPYLPKGIDYPKDAQGKPMILLAQINFSEAPNLQDYPEKGIFQLYISSDNWYDCEDSKILYFDDLSLEPQTDFSFLTPELYYDCPIDKEYKLEFKKTLGFGGYEDVRFNLDFEGMSWFDFYDALNQEQKDIFHEMFSGYGHKIGGYAFFTQSDPRSYTYENAKEDILLLQIDSDSNIMFGDSGVAHVFINRQSLIDKDFSKSYFYWDCA